jgi:uncharacterized protein (DUF58 family)
VKRFLVLSALIYILFLLGLAMMNRGLLALVLPLTIFLGVALFYGPGDFQLKIARTIDDHRVPQGTDVVIKVLITNEGKGLEEVFVEDIFSQSLEVVAGKPQVLTSLPRGGTVQLEYTVRGIRGSFTFRKVRVTASDHLGILRRQVLLSAPGQFIVLPKPLKLKRLAISPVQTRGYAGPVPARQAGSGVEFFGVREYRIGDPRNWINWRLSARHPRGLLTNEFETEQIADIGLILDARKDSDVSISDNSLFEYSVRATASLAEIFLSDGNRVGLLIYGTNPTWTFPGYGKTQRKKIFDALVRGEARESGMFANLDYLPVRRFPPRSQIVMISPLLNDDAAMLIRLRSHGYQILVISPDPVDFEFKQLRTAGSKFQLQDIELAARIARLEREMILRRLRQAGIQTVDWKVDKPLASSIHTTLGRLSHQSRPMYMEAS